jgi:hypothetical protein
VAATRDPSEVELTQCWIVNCAQQGFDLFVDQEAEVSCAFTG